MNHKFALFAALLVGVSAFAQEPEQADQDSSALLALSNPLITAVQDTSKGRPPADFIDVDVQPEVIKKVDPYFPELAQKAGMEGKVWVKIWVDSTGAVRDVVVLKSDAEIFNAPSIEAAKKFVFKPAYIGNTPVAVWVSVPFRYKLSGKPDTLPTARETVSPKDSLLVAAIRGLLEGSKSPQDISTLLAPHATAIAGGYLKQLHDVVRDQQAGKGTIEESERKVVFTTSQIFGAEKTAYMVFRTEPLAGKAKPHYHTIVFSRSPDGTPAILHWHVGK
ncbi:MAG: TonB family protein [Bacteroidota bacterium]